MRSPLCSRKFQPAGVLALLALIGTVSGCASTRVIRAAHDPGLRARIVACEALEYDDAASAAEKDRSPFVRGASGLEYFGEHLAIVQDDTQFVALRAPGGAVTSLALPPGPGGRRRFQDAFGNKHLKQDLEAAARLHHRGRELLIAFGSGASPQRELIVVVERELPAQQVRLRTVRAAPLYRSLRAALGLAEDTLNIEGAAASEAEIVLLQRGVGTRGMRPKSVAVGLEREAFLRWLDQGGPAPVPTWKTEYQLGAQEGVPYGFSGLSAIGGGRYVFSASAEATASPLLDARVHGSKLGVLSADRAAWAYLELGPGRGPLKVESIVPARGRPDHFWIVIDPDDPDTAAHLCDVEMRVTADSPTL